MDFLIYLGKVNLYWIMLFACYWLMLRNHTFFKWNRVYLLASIAVAFALPLVIYPAAAPVLPVQYQVSADTFTFETAAAPQKPLITWIEALWMIYVAGVAIAAYRLLTRIETLRRFLKAGEAIELDDCTVVVMDSNAVGSFSFLKWIVINRNDYENHFDAILRHEMVHTRQWHSIDILLLEIVNVFFWYNPVLWLYKRYLQEVHEFLADEQASNRELYARFLVSYALNAPVTALTNHFFNASQIKNRIQMIYKSRTSRWLLSTYAVAATFIGLSAVIVAGCENQSTDQVVEAKEKLKPDANGVYSAVEEMPQFPGGQQEMFKFLARNIKYPTKAVRANVSGKVFLSFVVSEKGKISDIQVVKGMGFGMDEEAIRVVSQSPDWTPGKVNGKAVAVKFNLPINFQLEEDLDKTSDANAKETTVAAQPLTVIDGKKINDANAIKKLDPNKIESVNVLKGKNASDKYGADGQNGVLEVKTRPAGQQVSASDQKSNLHVDFTATESQSLLAKPTELNAQNQGIKVRFRGSSALGTEPLVVIDGVTQEERGEKAYSKINPDNIESISVLKNLSATSGYGEAGKNGVVLISTKK